MKQAIKRYNMVTGLSGYMIPFLLTAVVLPVLVIIGFGLFAIYWHGYVLLFIAIMAISSAVTIISAWYLKKRFQGESEETLNQEVQDAMVKPSSDWGDLGNSTWESANTEIDRLLEEDSQWQAMQNHAIEVVRVVAESCHGKNLNQELAFSAPEILRLVEEVSRRYRKTLLDNVPFVEKVNISTLKMAYDHRGKAKIAGNVWRAYRAYRIFTPIGLIAEAKGRLVNHFFSGLRHDLEFRLKRAFLQEVAGVAIDLYTGRFKVNDEELKQSQAVKSDKGRMAPAPEPIRICCIGQVSSGKSSVINALLGKMAAEVSILPSTGAVTVHQCRWEGHDVVHLVDLPGINGDDSTNNKLIREVIQSDLVLWVVKANQSARQPDVLFRRQIDSYYADKRNKNHRQPVMIGVLNHVDRLQPISEWHPPYDLNNPDSPKAQIICDALDYNKKTLHADKWVPLSVSPDREHFNLSALQSAVASEFEAAMQIQINRRHMDSNSTLNLAEQCNRMIRAGKSMLELYGYNK